MAFSLLVLSTAPPISICKLHMESAQWGLQIWNLSSLVFWGILSESADCYRVAIFCIPLPLENIDYSIFGKKKKEKDIPDLMGYFHLDRLFGSPIKDCSHPIPDTKSPRHHLMKKSCYLEIADVVNAHMQSLWLSTITSTHAHKEKK